MVERKGLGETGTTFSISGGDSGAFNVALRGGVTPVDSEASGTDIAYTYDKDSNVSQTIDEGGNDFDCTYDALNRKKSCAITRASGFIGTTSQTWKYDGLSRLTECFDNNESGDGDDDDVTCKYFYDSLSRKHEESQQLGASGTARANSCDFDLSCGCIGSSDPSACIFPDGRKTFNKYDRLNRLTRRFDDNGAGGYSDIGKYEYIGKWRVATLTYQNDTRLTHLGGGSGTTDVGFDGLRRIVNHRWESFTTQTPGNGTLIVGFEHQDGTGSLNPLYDRANNKKIEYKTHDPDNSEQYKYDSVYRLTSTGTGGQSANARGFERGTFSSTARTSMSTIAFQQDWDLDGVGNWVREDDNARVETRTHSDFNEISQRTVSGQNAGLTHDKNGNTTDTGNTSVSGSSFPGGGLRLEFDAFNRVKKVWNNANTPGTPGDDTQVAEYVYDCHNRRMKKEILNGGITGGLTNGSTLFYYDGWRVVEERDGSENILRQYTYGNYLDEVWTLDNRSGGVTVADLNDGTGNQRHFYHCNSLYHVYLLTDETGAGVEGYKYDAYGKHALVEPSTNGVLDSNGGVADWGYTDDTYTSGKPSTVGNPYTYTGQRFDPETGLMYYKNRYYSTELGRFVSRDPIGYEAGTLGLYEYALPTKYFDSYGLAGGKGDYECGEEPGRGKKCCCCPKDMTAEGKATSAAADDPMTYNIQWNIQIAYIETDKEVTDWDCTLTFEEESTKRPGWMVLMGMPESGWYEFYPKAYKQDLTSTTRMFKQFDDWHQRKRECPSNPNIKMIDNPSVLKKNTPKTIIQHAILEAGPDCKEICKDKGFEPMLRGMFKVSFDSTKGMNPQRGITHATTLPFSDLMKAMDEAHAKGGSGWKE